MAFEEFTTSGSGRPGNKNPILSICKHGTVCLNHAAVKKYHLKDYNYVVLYFDSDTQKIGFKFTNDSSLSMGIRKISNNSLRFTFSCNLFLKHHKIDNSRIRKYKLDHDGKSDLFVIQLEDPSKRLNRSNT